VWSSSPTAPTGKPARKHASLGGGKARLGVTYVALRVHRDRVPAELAIAVVAIPLTIVAGILAHLPAKQSVERQHRAAESHIAIMNRLMVYVFLLGMVGIDPSRQYPGPVSTSVSRPPTRT
jgi:hypothetical protein